MDKRVEGYLSRQKTEGLFRREAESAGEEVPAELVQKAKRFFIDRFQITCPHCHRAVTPFKRPPTGQKAQNLLWFALAAASFAGSFLFRRHYVQFLALAMLFGVKFIVDSKATKTQIMIYKALQEGDAGRSKDLQKTGSRL
ncbi:MAG: hypothetical protein HYT89_06165 [Candidatus Omnitrophica bacterium]|nr:hypothetical protein [Candidatus Omnitrophota bacterium]